MVYLQMFLVSHLPPVCSHPKKAELDVDGAKDGRVDSLGKSPSN
jgi:hypothetical protein